MFSFVTSAPRSAGEGHITSACVSTNMAKGVVGKVDARVRRAERADHPTSLSGNRVRHREKGQGVEQPRHVPTLFKAPFNFCPGHDAGKWLVALARPSPFRLPGDEQ